MFFICQKTQKVYDVNNNLIGIGTIREGNLFIEK